MTLEYPDPLFVLWAACCTDGKDSLRRYAESLPATRPNFFREIISIYTGDDVGSTESQIKIADMRLGLIRDRFNVCVGMRSIGKPGARGRAMRAINYIAASNTFAAYGDQYVANVLLLELEAWRVVANNPDLPPYKECADQFLGAVNDIVRPILDRPIRTVIEESAIEQPAPSKPSVAACIASIQELCSGLPRVYVNTNLASIPDGADPGIAWLTEGHFRGIFIVQPPHIYPQFDLSPVAIIANWANIAQQAGLKGDIIEFIVNDVSSGTTERM